MLRTQKVLHEMNQTKELFFKTETLVLIYLLLTSSVVLDEAFNGSEIQCFTHIIHELVILTYVSWLPP